MKIKILNMITLLTITMCILVGCAKCINTEYTNVEVNVVDEYYRSAYTTPVCTGKVMRLITHPAVYRIYVEYNGVRYTISGSDVHDKYKDKVGQVAIGILRTCTYDDGSVIYTITGLE